MTVLRFRTTDGVELAGETSLPQTMPWAAAVLLHPHPLMGGDMHAPVPDHLFRVLPDAGIAVLRFDFRGAGESGGEHGGGMPEAADVNAAISQLARLSALPVWLVGWSFGADVSLSVAGDQVAGWIAVAPPLKSVGEPTVGGSDTRPVHLLVPEHDQFMAPDAARAATVDWSATEVQVIAGADHFLAGRLGEVEAMVLEILNAEPRPQRQP